MDNKNRNFYVIVEEFINSFAKPSDCTFHKTRIEIVAFILFQCYEDNNVLIALEEDKGHYLDSCFMERAITGFCKTINKFLNNNIKIPVLIIHSFTRYKKFSEKLEEDLDTRKETIKNEINKNLKYYTLTDRDRIPSQKWFGKCENCYTDNVMDELIIQDIQFIKSLIPSLPPSPEPPLVAQPSLLPV